MTLRHTGALAAILALVVSASDAAAQANAGAAKAAAPTYALGDQMFSLDIGLLVPLFYENLSGDVYGPNLTLGGVGGLEWDAFLNDHLSLGAELAGNFSYSPNANALLLVALTGNVTYTFRFYPFEIPLYLGVGADLADLSPQIYVGPILKPGAGFFWDFASKWEAGVRVEYWWIPEIYFAGWTPGPSASMLGNFLTISLGATVHF